MESSFFERFLSPAERAKATCELASMGKDALPILKALFDGEAVNKWGVRYRDLGMPLDCSLVAAQRLGPEAKSLERFLRDAVLSGHRYAPAALSALGILEEASIAALSKSLSSEDLLFSIEAAWALYIAGLTNHPSVVRECQISPRAATRLHRIKRDKAP
jgi:HEAT repeat protein